jgi:hypothetical protein
MVRETEFRADSFHFLCQTFSILPANLVNAPLISQRLRQFAHLVQHDMSFVAPYGTR